MFGCKNKLQLKHTKSAIKTKQIDLLTELKDFKFVTAVVLELKKNKMMIKQNIKPFIRTQKQKQLLTKVILII